MVCAVGRAATAPQEPAKKTIALTIPRAGKRRVAIWHRYQHHHNIKTDGGAFYIMDPRTGDIVWLFDDGRWEYDEPQGPLAPKNKNWALTVGQAIAARRAAAKERNDS